MKILKNYILEGLRIGLNDTPENSIDEIIEKYLKQYFEVGHSVYHPNINNFNLKRTCSMIPNIGKGTIKSSEIEDSITDFWNKMLSYSNKIYVFNYYNYPNNDERKYIVNFIQEIKNSNELINIYQYKDIIIDTYESNKYMFFTVYNNKVIYIWIIEK